MVSLIPSQTGFVGRGSIPFRLLLGVTTIVFLHGVAAAATPAARTPARGYGEEPRASGPAGPRGASETTPRRRVDAGVVRAGGAVSEGRADQGGVRQAGAFVATADCSHCGRRGCNQCRPSGGRLGLPCNGKCDAGGCPAHCPVRPDQFGYYATRWRSWPGQAVRQVSHFDPATTPVSPPRTQVPTIDEESGIDPDDPAAQGADDDAEELGSPDAAMDDGLETDGPGAPDDAAAPDEGGAPAATDTPGDSMEDADVGRTTSDPDAATSEPATRPTGRPAASLDTGARANPLRRADRGGPDGWRSASDASVATAIIEADGGAVTATAEGPRTPAPRGATRAGGAVRGVTMSPGNPLR